MAGLRTTLADPLSDSDPYLEKSEVDVKTDAADDYGELAASETAEAVVKPPLWKRMFTGDVNEEYQTKRAMDSRHLVMIGVCCAVYF